MSRQKREALETLAGSSAGKVLARKRQAARSLAGGKDHGHAVAIHLRSDLDLGDIGEVRDHPIEVLARDIGVAPLAAAEENGHKDLVVLLEDLARLLELGQEVMVAGLRAKAQLLCLDLNLLLAVLFFFALLLVLEAAKVHDATDRRPRFGSHFDEIKTLLFSQANGLLNSKDSELRTIGVDDTHLWDADAIVNPRAALRGRLLLVLPTEALFINRCSLTLLEDLLRA